MFHGVTGPPSMNDEQDNYHKLTLQSGDSRHTPVARGLLEQKVDNSFELIESYLHNPIVSVDTKQLQSLGEKKRHVRHSEKLMLHSVKHTAQHLRTPW